MKTFPSWFKTVSVGPFLAVTDPKNEYTRGTWRIYAPDGRQVGKVETRYSQYHPIEKPYEVRTDSCTFTFATLKEAVWAII